MYEYIYIYTHTHTHTHSTFLSPHNGCHECIHLTVIVIVTEIALFCLSLYFSLLYKWPLDC
jgi:hypothetical protein